MAATRYWNGTTDVSWTTAANWSGAAIPVNGDSVVFPASATRGPTSNITLGALTLVAFEVQDGVTYDIASSGTYLTLATVTTLTDRGSGNCYYKFPVTALVVIDKGAADAQARCATTGVIARADFLGGNIFVEGGITTINIASSQRVGVGPFVTWNMGTDPGNMGTIIQDAGDLYMPTIGGWTLVGYEMSGGTSRVEDLILTGLIQTGGYIDARNTSGSPFGSNYHFRGGTFDCSRSLKSIGISTTYEWPAWRLIDANPTKFGAAGRHTIGVN